MSDLLKQQESLLRGLDKIDRMEVEGGREVEGKLWRACLKNQLVD